MGVVAATRDDSQDQIIRPKSSGLNRIARINRRRRNFPLPADSSLFKYDASDAGISYLYPLRGTLRYTIFGGVDRNGGTGVLPLQVLDRRGHAA